LITLVITLGSPPAAILVDLARRPGAFSWWYADVTNEVGDGLVLIWSLGLPFLPGLDPKEPAGARPALSLALYRRGKPEFYLLQDYGSAAAPVTIGADPWGDGRHGRTTFVTERSGTTARLFVDLDEAVPGTAERLKGSLTLEGADSAPPENESAAAHFWAPRIVHGVGRADLRLGDEPIELSGGAYFDSNFAGTPLQGQGIAGWLWGRVTFAGRTFVYYRTQAVSGETSTVLLTQGAEGRPRVDAVDLRLSKHSRAPFGVCSPRRIAWSAPTSSVRLELDLVEDGPFYQRFLVRGETPEGDVGRGIAEAVLPDRVGLRWQKPLVQMRTHVVGGRNSVWLPLFSGFRRGRFRRLLGLGAA
jgi:carotenoid 1,2-hydratase